MRVKMLTTMAGPDGVVQGGEVVDLPPAEAEGLKAGGYAVAYKEPAPVEKMTAGEDVETAVKETPAPTGKKGKKAGEGKNSKNRRGMQSRKRT